MFSWMHRGQQWRNLVVLKGFTGETVQYFLADRMEQYGTVKRAVWLIALFGEDEQKTTEHDWKPTSKEVREKTDPTGYSQSS